jgi:hypothetical protein
LLPIRSIAEIPIVCAGTCIAGEDWHSDDAPLWEWLRRRQRRHDSGGYVQPRCQRERTGPFLLNHVLRNWIFGLPERQCASAFAIADRNVESDFNFCCWNYLSQIEHNIWAVRELRVAP